MIRKAAIATIAALLLIGAEAANAQELVTVTPEADSLAQLPFKAHLDSIRAHRPTVALVLSGGGAKGAAEVGALRYLESIGMPVDIVLGTSIGGLVGGLYSIGYRSQDLDSLMRNMDWTEALSDRIPSRFISYERKKHDAKYLLTVPFYKNGLQLSEGKTSIAKKIAASMPGGLVTGHNVNNLITSLTAGWQDKRSFSTLPIPFVCVATDMVTGKAKVWYDGDLATAMRTTMSIPFLFAPVRTDGMVLVDGGLRDNFPVDIARKLGADIVIGITLADKAKDYDNTNNMMDLMMQTMNLFAHQIYEKNVAMTDVLIYPDLDGFDMLSFHPKAVDVMINRGYEAAVGKADDLAKVLAPVLPGKAMPSEGNNYVDLGQRKVQISEVRIVGIPQEDAESLIDDINLTEGPVGKKEIEEEVARIFGSGAFESVSYRIIGHGEPYDLEINCTEGPVSRAAVGARFDNEELVSVLLNIGFNVNSVKGSSLELTGKIGTNPYVSAIYRYKTGLGIAVGAESFYRYVDRNNFYLGDENFEGTFHQFRQDIFLSNFSRSFTDVKLGVRFEYFNFRSIRSDLLYRTGESSGSVQIPGTKDTYLSAFAEAVLDRFDSEYYPSSGYRIRGKYSWHPFEKETSKYGFHRVFVDASAVLPLNNHVAIIPSFYGRYNSGEVFPLPYFNFAGGMMPGRYFDQQMPFAGINGAFCLSDVTMIGRADLRFRLAANHYITATYNYEAGASSIKHMFGRNTPEGIHGAAIEYGWNTIAGPFRLSVQWNSALHKTGFFFALGKNF